MNYFHLPALLSAAALVASAQGALTFFGDTFESPSPVPEEGVAGAPTGWTATGSAFIGRFNADDDTGTEWYHGIADFEDGSASGGEVGSMDGPSKVTIFAGGSSAGGDYLEKTIGTIEANTLYEAVIAISGSRTAPNDAPLGYSIDLMSGSTVLSSTSGTAAEAAALLFDDVTVAWDSSVLPGGVSYGDDLSFRVTTVGTTFVSGKVYYIDFDDVQFSETIVPEPSLSVLLTLSGLGLLLRRKRS